MIGGEFEIHNLPESIDCNISDKYTYTASGRSALSRLLTYIANEASEILLPDWLCESVIEAVEYAKFKYKFYKLNEKLEPDLTDLSAEILNGGG